ncbi:hypothetical protein J4E85_009189 [Alternaria conjuncta]|uniref:uncharacterized protein n=1 Tax=Alternaria conjuncta TaxID=181017 RepID=UPI0022203852|nr:uncharacterized protein J4E85_009189 [Alternaria conjuncta]KAI4920422.1 hypothetical protein J4E85_009189 [Alternaria conjuncta]
MDSGKKRALSPSAVTLAKKQKLDGDANDNRIIREAMARIRARHRSETERDDIYKSNATDSPLLRLPGEIRNMIFGWVFRGVEYGLSDAYWTHDSVVRMQIENTSGSHALHDVKLLLVCRQVHAETALLPYNLGSFGIRGEDESWEYYEWLHALEKFLKRRTEEQIGAISRLKFDEYRDGASQFPELMEETGAFWVANLAEAWKHKLLLRLNASLAA